MPDLISYIKQQLKAGYDINTIRTALIKYGYQPGDIDAAMRQAYAEPSVVKHVVHLSPALIITVIAVAIIAGGAFFLFKPGAPSSTVPTELLDLSADITSLDISPGSSLEFDVGIMNLGAANRYDVALRYLIINQDNKAVKTKEETVAIETRFSTKAQVTLPPNLPLGNYKLRVIARYNGNIATAEETFSVARPRPVITEPEEPAPEFKEPEELVCDDGDICTTDSIVDDACSFAPITPCCGNNICESGEDISCSADCPVAVEAEPEPEPTPEPEPPPAVALSIWDELDQIEYKAATDPVGAAHDCSEITDSVFRDDCYSGVAEASTQDSYCSYIETDRTKDTCLKDVAIKLDDPDLCARIITDSVRDQCYMSFVTAGNYESCEKLTNPFLQQNCNQLEQLARLSPGGNLFWGFG